jgi:hypothetical protein
MELTKWIVQRVVNIGVEMLDSCTRQRIVASYAAALGGIRSLNLFEDRQDGREIDQLSPFRVFDL